MELSTENKTYSSHSSWNSNQLNINDTINRLTEFQRLMTLEPNIYASSFQHDCIPVYDINSIDLTQRDILNHIYLDFFYGSGVLIVKNAYSNNLMDKYNSWCENTLDSVKNDGNFIHPKQKDKFLINNVIDRMSDTDPDLLMSLIGNKYMNQFIDLLLGLSKFGSCTTHWIQPGGDRQISHVDYPIHVGSAPFWESNVDKIKNLTTSYQLNHILPYFSVQLLIASDNMSIKNGSTEVVPCSHRLENIDMLIHEPNFYEKIDNHFKNVTLEKGDFLIFNRRLCHRGGKNISQNRRNSLIIQCVWLWGVGQELIDSTKIIERLENNSKIYNQMSEKDRIRFNLRLKPPYPLDVSKST